MPKAGAPFFRIRTTRFLLLPVWSHWILETSPAYLVGPKATCWASPPRSSILLQPGPLSLWRQENRLYSKTALA